MTKTELNEKDKLRLNQDITISIMIGLLFTLAFVIIFGLIFCVELVFLNPSHGFVKRGIFILGVIFTLFLCLSWTNFLKYIDFRKGKKLIFKTDDYEVISKNDSAYILTRDNNNRKIEIDNELIQFIKPSQPLIIEVSNLAKSLLFISHDTDNLLDKLYNDE
jgi:hypothetical protein